jgi:hypothetical protein
MFCDELLALLMDGRGRGNAVDMVLTGDPNINGLSLEVGLRS